MKAILLISGGLDSMVSAFVASKKFNSILGITFDYGQRAARSEIKASAKICRAFNIKHKVINLPWLKDITNTSLVNKKKKVPHPNDLTKMGKLNETARAVWVPNRNALFLNIAGAFAESLGAKYIVTGFNKEESATFPDNSARFVKDINRVFLNSTMSKPKVVSFVQDKTKKDIVAFALKEKLPLGSCWPCYEGGKKLCGKCESCVRFFRAVEQNGGKYGSDR